MAIVSERVAAINLRRMPIAELKPHPRNPRVHPAPSSPLWAVMRKSLSNDYFDPVVWNERNGFIVSGHLRVRVLTELGFEFVDVSVVDYDEAVHLARLIAANRLLGEWEDTILASLATEIEAAGIDAALAGYDEKALLALLDAPEIPSDDELAEQLLSEAEKLQEKWGVRLGDLYQIADHRLICGDCGALENWGRLLQGGQADMVWTDPPYNVAYDGSRLRQNESSQESHGSAPQVKPKTMLNDDVPEGEYEVLLKTWFSVAFQVTKPGGAIYIAHADSHGNATRTAALQAGWKLAQCLIWVKANATLGRQDYQWQHEPILYGWHPAAGHYWQGGFAQRTVIDDEKPLSKLSKAELIAIINDLRNSRDTTVVREARDAPTGLHPTVKPVRLVARHVWNSSRRGDTVLELFGGSGTTIAAAQQIGRRCVATELDPKYCAVILERLNRLGLQPEKVDG